MAQPRIQASDFAATVRNAGGPGSLIGFRSERRTLYRWIDRAGRDAAAALLISGPSGSGKTRLARAALAHARRHGVAASRGACEPMHGPFSPVVEALRESADVHHPPGVRQQLASCIARRPELSELVGTGPDPVSRLTPDTVGRSSLFQALARGCFALCASGPALLVLEDCQWADETALAFLRYLVTRARVHSLRILVTCRTRPSGELPGPVHQLAEALGTADALVRMALGGLTEPEVADLVRTLYPRNRFSQQLRQGVLEATAGNPAAIRSALRLFEAEGLIYRQGDGWCERRAPRGRSTTGDIYDSLVERLEGLSPDVVRLLRLAALSGPAPDPAVLARASAMPRVRFLRALGVLTRIHAVLSQDEDRLAFTAGEIPEIVRRRIPRQEVAPLHACLADALEGCGPDLPVDRIEAIAQHRLSARDPGRALPLLLDAGDRAARFGTHDRALHFYRRALKVLGDAPGVTDARDTRLQVLEKVAEAHTTLKQWSAAESTCLEMIDLAGRWRDGVSMGRGHLGLGRIRAKRKTFDQALVHYKKALQIFLESDDAYHQCLVLSDMTGIYLEQGRWQDLEAACSSAVGLARDLGYQTPIAAMTTNRAIMYAMKGCHARAAAAFEQCLSLNRRLGRQEAVISCLINLGKCAADSGDTETARRRYLLALRHARRRYDVQREAVARLNLGEVYLAEGKPDLCQQCCERALVTFEEIDHRVGIADANRLLGRAAGQRNDHYTAFTRLEKSIACNRQTGYRLGEAESLRDYGCYLIQGNPESATGREALAEARRIYAELGVAGAIHEVDALLGA